MSDMGDTFKALRRHRQDEGERNRKYAADEFAFVQDIAATRDGIDVKRLDDSHYQFILPNGSLLNFYPGNQRLYWDKNRPKGPHLKHRDEKADWTLTAVLDAIQEGIK
ncbi:MAG: hypothetical protein IMZ57_13485 [Acidobacteria bacterium]|nr:hypothetical protein [Acidobacteriota bacterium]